jgi:hypothetical protein
MGAFFTKNRFKPFKLTGNGIIKPPLKVINGLGGHRVPKITDYDTKGYIRQAPDLSTVKPLTAKRNGRILKGTNGRAVST